MFMKPEILFGDWIVVDDRYGEQVGCYPASMFNADEVNKLHSSDPLVHDVFTVVEKYGVRLSAPGYLDCTEWTLCATAAEAKEYLVDTFDLCPKCFGPADDVCGCEQ